MLAPQQIQERRRDELSRIQLGPHHLPIVEGELPIGRIRFERILAPVVRDACRALRKPASILYRWKHCIGRLSRIYMVRLVTFSNSVREAGFMIGAGEMRVVKVECQP
jgi:hypothetical protein